MTTFRSKIALGATLLIILITVIGFVLTVCPLRKKAEEEVVANVKRAAQVVPLSQHLHAYELVSIVKSVASRPEFVKGILETEEKPRRAGVFDAITQYDNELREKKKKAHFFAVVDKEGRVIARDLDMHSMYGEELPHRGIKEALAGNATSAVWLMKNRMMRAAASPITNGGEIIGAVVIAYDFTAAEAREDHERVKAHVAYFLGDAIRATSFVKEGDEDVEDSTMGAALNAAVMGTNGKAQQAIDQKKTIDIFELRLHQKKFLAIAGPLHPPVEIPVEVTRGKAVAKVVGGVRNVGFVVLVSIDDAFAPVTKIQWSILGGALICFVLVFLGMWAVARYFVGAEDKLELGVSEVINGNVDYVFDALQEFEGLANALNVMLARLLGRPEPGEETDGEQGFDPRVILIEEVERDEQKDEVARVAEEPEDEYYARLYNEYIAELEKLHYDTSSIMSENITQKLKANAAMLKAKHKCQNIRFKVNRTPDGLVAFKPIKIP
ncbi:MAG: MXAN_5187 C-terminal domain-containing protein [Pseudomonadota bacterium]